MIGTAGRRDRGVVVAHANAGVLVPPASLVDLDRDQWNRVLAVDLTGVTFRRADSSTG